ncbi:MAG: PilZ domain-containing protein [Planctomycetes bacterium]|nr:PilZ domain-containing protein [Planctomycetota bacterium]
MKPLLPVDEAKKNDILAHAIARNQFSVVTNRSQGAWVSRKTKFISAEDATDRIFIEATDAATEQSLTYLSGELVGVTFRRGHRKCLFSTSVIGATSVQQEDGALVNVIELHWPTELQELQRRVFQRAVPIARHVSVRFWQGGVSERGEAEGNGVFTATMVDLSAGGMRFLSTDVAPDTFEEGEPIGCSFRPMSRGETLVVDGIFRHLQLTADGLASIGIQFVGLECSEQGRQTLAALAGVVSEYQRALRSRGKSRMAPRLVRQ